MKLKIIAKLLIAVIFIGCLGILAGLTYSQFTTQQLVQQRIADRVAFLKSQINEQMSKKIDVGLTNAIGFAANQDLQKALKNKDRSLAQQVIASVSDLYKKNSNFKNIQIHLHTPEMKSFFRSWAPEAFDDDLSAFRYSLKEVVGKKKGWSGFEIGTIGLAIRSIVPVMAGDELLGSLEFIQGVNSVFNDLQKVDCQYILLVQQQATAISSKLKNFPQVGPYLVSNSKWFNEETVAFAKALNYEELHSKGFLTTAEHLVTYVPVLNYKGEEVGIQVIGEKLTNLQSQIATVKKLSTSYLLPRFTGCGTRLAAKPGLVGVGGQDHFWRVPTGTTPVFLQYQCQKPLQEAGLRVFSSVRGSPPGLN